MAVTRGTTTAQVKALAGEKGEGMRLCVIPVDMQETRLISYVKERAFQCVSSEYVGERREGEAYLLDYLSKEPIPDIKEYTLL